MSARQPPVPGATPAGRPLRVGLNLMFLDEHSGGAGRYAAELIPELLRAAPGIELFAFVNRAAPQSLLRAPWAGELRWLRSRIAVGRPPWHIAHQQLVLPRWARRLRLDLVHGLANTVPVVSPGVKTVDTLLDITWLHYPESLPDPVGRVVMRTVSLTCARRADRVVAISHAAKRDFVATLALPAEKIDVTPLGIRLDRLTTPTPEPELRERLGIGPGPIVLCVAQKRPHKNLARLIEAMPALADRGARLVLPGAPTAHEVQLRALAAARGVADRVHFPAWVSEPDLEGLYAAASCVALPSLAEGFGLPVLEAMRRGVPVACSDRFSLPEVAGDAALIFDAESQPAIDAALHRLLSEPELAADLVRRGRERCAAFTWRTTAEATLRAYAHTLTGTPADP